MIKRSGRTSQTRYPVIQSLEKKLKSGCFPGQTPQIPSKSPKIRALNGLPSNISTKKISISWLLIPIHYSVIEQTMLSDQWLRPLNAGMANALTLRIFSQRLPDRWDLQLDRSMASHTGTGQPKFMFHAWNEVYINDQWISVDATWNQNPADSTHISLDDNEYSAILLASTTKSVEFEVTSVSYD